MSGLYHGLNRGAETLAAHNRNVPADTQADACTCDLCRAADAGPAAAVPSVAAGLDFEKVLLEREADLARMRQLGLAAPDLAPTRQRGPVQDESISHDPLDAHAMRVIEGRRPADDLDDCHEVYGR